MDNLTKMDLYLGAGINTNSQVTRVNVVGYVTGVTTVKSVDSLATAAAGGLPASATATKVSSGSTSDTSAGTGARTVLITGLDANYAVVSETATLSGQTGVTLANQYLRVNSIVVLTAGSGGVNAGIIYVGTGTITTGVPAVIIGGIAVGDNRLLAARYTVPAGQKLIIQQFHASTYDVSATLGTGVKVQIDMKIRTVATGLNELYRRTFLPATNEIIRLSPALILPEKTDVWWEVVGTVAASTSVTAAGFLINGG